METIAVIQAEIANIEALLNSGATSIESDGETVALDHDQLRRRLRELKSSLAGAAHQSRRVRSLDLRNTF